MTPYDLIAPPRHTFIEAVEGIAIVARASDGRRVLLMSKDVRSTTIRTEPIQLHPAYALEYGYTAISANIGAYYLSMWEPDPSPPPQVRGIYLPDMSFRALPEPKD